MPKNLSKNGFNWCHVNICLFFIDLKAYSTKSSYIIHNFLQSWTWTWTKHFSNSTGLSVTTVVIGSPYSLTWVVRNMIILTSFLKTRRTFLCKQWPLSNNTIVHIHIIILWCWICGLLSENHPKNKFYCRWGSSFRWRCCPPIVDYSLCPKMIVLPPRFLLSQSDCPVYLPG
jgi:hypothetical protein